MLDNLIFDRFPAPRSSGIAMGNARSIPKLDDLFAKVSSIEIPMDKIAGSFILME
jgi:hypothetical protein